MDFNFMKGGFDAFHWLQDRGLYRSVWKREMRLLVRNIKEKVVLDAGCGTGYTAYSLSSIARVIVGIDFKEKRINEAKEKYQADNLYFMEANIEKIPFPDSFFDIVYSCWVLEHLEHPEQFLKEVHRVLKPDGILLLLVPNVKNLSGILVKYTPFALQKKMESLLMKITIDKVSQDPCYYRANSVHLIDKLTKKIFNRRYLERLDAPIYYRHSRLLFSLWLIRSQLSRNPLLNWLSASFYAEYIAIKK